MYVRKFEAETMEEALKSIKQELGPDAIILKTLTNKGLKGAFKKNRIEITAAISEKNYTKKARVDTVLSPGQKDEFYSGSSGYISNMIDRHDNSIKATGGDRTHTVKNPGYGNMSLNKPVQQVKKLGKQIKTGLDDFLNSGVGEISKEEFEPMNSFEQALQEEPVLNTNTSRMEAYEEKQVFTEVAENNFKVETLSEESNKVVEAQRSKIEELEKKLWELSRSVERLDKKEATGIYQLRTTLRSLDIDESFVQEIIKKASFELSQDDVQNPDIVFEFALREMITLIPCEMPLFSSADAEDGPVITILLSETSCGQTSMLHKISAMKENSVLVKNSGSEKRNNFTEQVFGMSVVETHAIAEIVAETRKAIEKGQSVFIDYKASADGVNETKKLVDGLKRSFDKVEVLISLSAIHSELYNKKVAGRYRSLAQGLVISNLDLCLNYGALFNVTHENPNLPMKFFGTGETVPDDLESATAERILAGLFQFD